MAAHGEFDFIAEALLDAGHDEVGALGCAQLLLQVGLIKPGNAQFAGIVRNSGDGAHATTAGTCAFYFPDEPERGSDFTKGDGGDFFEFAVITMFTWEIKQQVTHGTDAKVVQPCSDRWSYARDGGDVSAQQGEGGVPLRHVRFQANRVLLRGFGKRRRG